MSAVNSDVVGWIKLDGSVIDYPIAQCDNNDYYLHHLFNKEVNSSGCIFLDSRNNSDFSDRNSVIYGHHMKNGSMFSAITNYKNQSYYYEHPKAHLYTPQGNYEVEIFAGYVADLQDSAWNTELADEKLGVVFELGTHKYDETDYYSGNDNVIPQYTDDRAGMASVTAKMNGVSTFDLPALPNTGGLFMLVLSVAGVLLVAFDIWILYVNRYPGKHSGKKYPRHFC